MWYRQTILASAEAEDTSSFGVMLYQYTASGMVHHFLAVIFYSSVTLLDDAITRGDVCMVKLKSDSPLI